MKLQSHHKIVIGLTVAVTGFLLMGLNVIDIKTGNTLNEPFFNIVIGGVLGILGFALFFFTLISLTKVNES